MRIEGRYDERISNEPQRIEVSGSRSEWDRVGFLPDGKVSPSGKPTGIRPAGPPMRADHKTGKLVATDDPWSVTIRANRDVVHDLSRKVEIQCDDQRLIDWMKG